MPELNATDTASPTEDAWITVSLHEPSPNARFAAFVHRLDDGTFPVTVLAVDFVALQQVTLADDDRDEDETDTRIVPVVIDWTGATLLCLLDGGDGFVAVGASAAACEAKGREVAEGLAKVAVVPGATPP